MTIPKQQDNMPDDTSISKEGAIPSIFSDFDLYLFGQGKNYRIYEKMGAHERVVHGVAGVNFAVWAPNALSISVIGDFNGWNRTVNQMQLRHTVSGVCVRFIFLQAQPENRFKRETW